MQGMNSREIEVWALRVIKRAELKQPSEDSLSELKRVWPADLYKAARQIAGQANAARGEPVLWLIGVDEKSGVTIGAEQKEFSSWIAGIGSQFEGLAPRCQDLNVSTNKDLTVVALVFESDRAPYVVRNPEFGVSKTSIAFEVPWREGTKVRSATRGDLLVLLAEKRSLSALLGEMEWNRAVAARPANDHAQFRDQEFQRNLIDGSLAELDEGLKPLILEAYLTVSSAQSHKRTLESSADHIARSLMEPYVSAGKANALKAITRALDELRLRVGG